MTTLTLVCSMPKYKPFCYSGTNVSLVTAGHSGVSFAMYSLMYTWECWSQWLHGLWCWSAAACLLRSWVRISPGAWIFVCCECCVLSGRGLCDKLITCPEEFYRLWCVIVCDLETSRMRRPWPTLGRSATGGGDSHGSKNEFLSFRLFILFF
jgi:hypothetical protein